MKEKNVTVGEVDGGGVYDLSLHPDQYYILVSETNYPPGLGARLTRRGPRCWSRRSRLSPRPGSFLITLQEGGWWEGGF